jgi:putative membrane protein
VLTDFILTCLHHVAIFCLFAALIAELALVRSTLTIGQLERLARIDMLYGICAGLVIVAGVMRVIWGAKGWYYYMSNWMFWAKMAVFALIGGLSIPVTIAFAKWRRRQPRGQSAVPAAEISYVQRLVWAQAALFLLLPVLAAGMARGYGL